VAFVLFCEAKEEAMRIVLSLSALALAGAAAPPAIVSAPNLSPDDRDATVCRDRIQTVRAERGLPKLDRGDARADKPLLILAVDQRIGGCSVMVMKNDTSDIRPLPAPKDGPVRLERIPDQ
jgi:hypothetical protein